MTGLIKLTRKGERKMKMEKLKFFRPTEGVHTIILTPPPEIPPLIHRRPSSEKHIVLYEPPRCPICEAGHKPLHVKMAFCKIFVKIKRLRLYRKAQNK